MFFPMINTIRHTLFLIYLFTSSLSPNLELECDFHRDGDLSFISSLFAFRTVLVCGRCSQLLGARATVINKTSQIDASNLGQGAGG